jgi:pSer/pThr/pTyr-binding forkhead associated (FHA) protein
MKVPAKIQLSPHPLFSNMISRDHSVIMGEQDEKGKFTHYVISDRSLNGTYVNDTRVGYEFKEKL